MPAPDPKTDIGAFRASALRQYGREIPAADLAELSQKEFDGIHERARLDWEVFEARRITKSWRQK